MADSKGEPQQDQNGVSSPDTGTEHPATEVPFEDQTEGKPQAVPTGSEAEQPEPQPELDIGDEQPAESAERSTDGPAEQTDNEHGQTVQFDPLEIIYDKKLGILAASDDGKFLFWTARDVKPTAPSIIIRVLRITDILASTFEGEPPFLRVCTDARDYHFEMADDIPSDEEQNRLDALRKVVGDRRARVDAAAKDEDRIRDDSEVEEAATEAKGSKRKGKRKSKHLGHLPGSYSSRELADKLHFKYDWRGVDNKQMVDNFIQYSGALEWAMEMLVEDEIRRDQMLNRSKPKARVPRLPEIKHFSWEDWEVLEPPPPPIDGRPLPKRAAIEVLDEDPSPRLSVPSRPGRKPRTIQPAGEESARTVDVGNQGKRRRLPDRIKITSLPIQRILQGLLEHYNAVSYGDQALVMPRPYKSLTLSSDAIKERLAELESMHEERQKTEKSSILPKEESKSESTEPKRYNDPPQVVFSADSDWAKFSDDEVKEAVEDFRCLNYFYDNMVRPVREYLQDEPDLVHFDELWHLFKPGMLIYVKDINTPQKIWKSFNATGGRQYYDVPTQEDGRTIYKNEFQPFRVDCFHLDWDGKKYTPVYARFAIDKFEDAMPVKNLQVMPLKAAVRAGLVDEVQASERGKQFTSYTKPQHRYYAGHTVATDPDGRYLYKKGLDEDTGDQRVFSERVESQVVIDIERAVQAEPSWSPHHKSRQLRVYRPEQPDTHDGYERVQNDVEWDLKAADALIDAESKKWDTWDKNEAQPEGSDLLLFPPRVFGFVLRSRDWASFSLDALQVVERQADAWQDLEIPSGHKSIVQSLINSHFAKDKSKDTQFDLVRDKGKGVIILLHGVPGVGKTATAECVAASNQKPLLPITCGDLGLYPTDVEATLQKSFQLAQAWDCVMLLDEADVFLAQRTNQDIERNALVSVFLRVLEYYEGVLLLTTNRVGAFDEAFKSRVHMALYYPPLKWLQTEKIWRSQIRRARERPLKVDCNEEHLLGYANELFEGQKQNLNSIGPVWNGRQIRNAFQSAIALARNESSKAETIALETRHFKTVAEVSNEFNNYIWRVKSGRTDADIAKEIGVRDDAYSAAAHQRAASQGHTYGHFPPPPSMPMTMPMRQPTPAGYSPFMTPQTAQPAAQYGSPYAAPQAQQQAQPYPNQPPPQFAVPQQGYMPQQQQPQGQPLQYPPQTQQQYPPQPAQGQNPFYQPSGTQPGYQAPPSSQGHASQPQQQPTAYSNNPYPGSQPIMPQQDQGQAGAGASQ